MNKYTNTCFGLLLCFTLSLTSCSLYFQQPLKSSKARIGEQSQMHSLLDSLPNPKDLTVVAVYKFTDQTGQYKPSNNGASWSTAVTQGATSILVRALEDSGWFVPIERENVGNLFNERKIIRSSRAQYSAEGNNAKNLLPPLLYAGIILEGGIIAYDANIITGGAGLRYFGAGGSGQYRQDRVSIYLRAISTRNGKVLKTVHTSKTILSQSVDVGLFRFVSFKRLLEAETGITYNEPAEMAVTEAIEKAVHMLIVEGLTNGMWTTESESEAQRLVAEYKSEKAMMKESDILHRRNDSERLATSVGVYGTTLVYDGDYVNAEPRLGAELSIKQHITPALALTANVGIGELGTYNFLRSEIRYAGLNATWFMLPFSKITPIMYGGGGIMQSETTSPETVKTDINGFSQYGIGLDYQLNPNLTFTLSSDYNYLFSDNIDRMKIGKFNDVFWKVRLGINYAFDTRGKKSLK